MKKSGEPKGKRKKKKKESTFYVSDEIYANSFLIDKASKPVKYRVFKQPPSLQSPKLLDIPIFFLNIYGDEFTRIQLTNEYELTLYDEIEEEPNFFTAYMPENGEVLNSKNHTYYLEYRRANKGKLKEFKEMQNEKAEFRLYHKLGQLINKEICEMNKSEKLRIRQIARYLRKKSATGKLIRCKDVSPLCKNKN